MIKIFETKDKIVGIGLKPRSDLADWIVPAGGVFALTGGRADVALILGVGGLIQRVKVKVVDKDKSASVTEVNN